MAKEANEEDWIKVSRDNGFFYGEFVPFRRFVKVEEQGMIIVGYWESWLSTNNGSLQKFSVEVPEQIDDLFIAATGERGDAQLDFLNRKEEAAYRERIRGISLASLQAQRKQWQELRGRKTIRTAITGPILYAPVDLLGDEIQDRIVDERLQGIIAKPNKRFTSISTWSKNKTEFCHYVRTEYEGHREEYRSERDAVFKLFPKFRFSDREWTAEKCYQLLRQIHRS